MSLIRRLGRPGLWNRKNVPTVPVEVDWSHPLARGLVSCYLPGVSKFDIAGLGPVLSTLTDHVVRPSPFGPLSSGGADSGSVLTDAVQFQAAGTIHVFGKFDTSGYAVPFAIYDAVFGGAIEIDVGFGTIALAMGVFGYWEFGPPYISGAVMNSITAAFTFSGSLKLYQAGAVTYTGTSEPAPSYSGRSLLIGGNYAGFSSIPAGFGVGAVHLYNRQLSDQEVAWLDAEPFAMLRPVTRRIFSAPAASSWDGTASGTGTATAVGQSIAVAAGAAAGTSTATATGSALGIGAGSAAGTGTATGVGIGKRGTVTLFGSSFATTNSSAFTATATPAVGDLLVVIGGFTGNVATPTVTDNNSSGTYTLVNSALKATSADKLYMWVRNARIASAASTVVTITPSGATTGGGLAVYRIAGGDRVGSAAVRQSAVQANQTSGTPAPAMAAAANRKNVILGGVMNAKNPAGTTAPTGFARDTNLGYATPTAGLTTVSKVSDFGLSTLTWGGTGGVFASIVAEFDVDIASVGAASGTGTATGVAPSAASAGSASGTGAASAVGAAIWTATGTASGTGAAAATGQATASGAGSAAGTSTAIATPIVSGAASGIGTATAVGAALAAATGSASGTGSAAAVGTSLALATGSASGTGTATGVALTAASVGSAAGSGTAAAVGAPLATGTGAAAGVGAASAAGASTAAGAGSAAGTGAATGSGRSTATAAGASAGTGTATAVGTVTTVGAGSAAGTGTASATGAALATAVGSASGAGVATGAAVTGASVGSAAGQGTATGVGAPLATGTGASSGTGAATATGQATATSTGAASGIGSATATPVVRGIATGTGTATGVGASLAVAAGSAAGVGAASAVGASTATATGTASGVGTATGIVQSVGFASGTSTAAAVGKAVSIGAGQAAGTGVAAAAGSSLALAIGIASGSAIVIAVPRLDALPRPQDSAASARIVGNAATGRSGGSGAIPRTVPAGASARLSGNAAGPRN